MPRDSALLVLRDGAVRREWALKDVTVIGREPECDVSLPDRQVSRRHVIIRWTTEGYTATDEGSKNGTWHNGERLVGSVRLVDGDELSVAARYKLYFVDTEATAPLLFEGRGLRLDPATLSVFVNGLPLDPPLSLQQFELLRALWDAEGAVVGREAMIHRVWPFDEGAGVTDDAVDSLVRRVRLRLAELDPGHSFITTVRGYGYRLNLP
jgi:hypothetical protein